MPYRETSIQSAPWIWWGLHGTLFVLTIVGALREASPVAASLAVGLVIWQGLGLATIRERRSRWPDIWLAVLASGWATATLSGQTEFVWIAFPLFFFELFMLPTPVGVMAVAATTFVAVLGLDDDGLTVPEVLGPALGAAVATGAVMAYRALAAENQRNRQLAADLANARDRLTATERQRGVLDERRRLAREVHDTIAQGLSSIVLLARAEELAGHTSERITQVAEIAQQNLDEARRIVAALNPSTGAEPSLPDQIRQAAHSLAAASPARLEVTVDGDAGAADAEAEFTLLRVAQGALANALKHSDAGQVSVRLTYLDESVTVEVSDDGVGYDPANLDHKAQDSGYGIEVMRDRIDAAGGTLRIDTRPGHGTTVTATVPTGRP